ncbi:MAG: nicotinamide mononucleotide transporter [Bacteroidia bacterium]|jgi:nicotinamide mononucleotide transporter
MIDIINIVVDYFNHFWGYVELAGTIAGAICVYLAVKQNIWTWFWGAIAVAFFGPMFWEYKLYSDAWLQIVFYLPMQVLGWYWWMKRGPNHSNDLPVVSLKARTSILIVFSIIAITALNGFLMANYTDASFPYADALTTWMSIFAQILMIRKVVESWALWVVMDFIAIFIYAAKGLIVVSGLYGLFLVLATMGGIAWYKSLKLQKV